MIKLTKPRKFSLKKLQLEIYIYIYRYTYNIYITKYITIIIYANELDTLIKDDYFICVVICTHSSL